jgi:stage II sporulation protein B
MDKQQNTQKIKIKINGEDRPFVEEVEIHDWKESEKEASAASEEIIEEDGFEWVLPEIQNDQVSEFKKIYYADTSSKEKKKTKKIGKKPFKGWSTIIIAAGTAVTIGIVLGYVLLKVVIYQEQSLKNTEGILPKSQAVAANGNALKSITVPVLQTSVVQNNVFTSASSAESAAGQLKDSGYPAVAIPIQNQQYLFIGVANNLTNAKQLASNLFKSNVTVYAKDTQFGGDKISNATSDEAALLSNTVTDFQSLSTLLSAAFLNSNVDSSALKEMGKEVKALNGLKNIQNKHMKNLISSQSASYKALVDYQASKDQKKLIQAEQGLLDFLKEYSSL